MITSKEIYNWFKERNISNIRVFSNPISRILGFADISKSEYIICNISIFKKDKRIYKKWIEISKCINTDGAMLRNWYNHIINNT
jgi:hypothetical protein